MIFIIKCGLWRVRIIESLDNRSSDNWVSTVLNLIWVHVYCSWLHCQDKAPLSVTFGGIACFWCAATCDVVLWILISSVHHLLTCLSRYFVRVFLRGYMKLDTVSSIIYSWENQVVNMMVHFYLLHFSWCNTSAPMDLQIIAQCVDLRVVQHNLQVM